MNDNFIFMMNTRRNGVIAYNYVIKSKEDLNRVVKIGKILDGRCDYDVVHTFNPTEELNPKAKFVNSLDEFIYYLALEQRTTSLDVAEYILSICSCTYRELQHLVIKSQLYYTYCYHKDLCDDKLIDLPSGPAYEELFKGVQNKNSHLESEGHCNQFKYVRDGKRKMCAINDVLGMEILEGVESGEIKFYKDRKLDSHIKF